MDFTLVIVDDDEICLRVHKRICEISGFHNSPQTFNCAQNALDFIACPTNQIKPVLLFLDINMPVINGWDLLNIIDRKDFNRQVYVVIVSSSVDIRDKEKAFSFSRVIDFVEKPFSSTVLERLKLVFPWMQDRHDQAKIN